MLTIRVSKRKRRGLALVMCGLVLLLGLVMMDRRLRPIITTIAQNQAKLLATNQINNAVMDVIEQEDVVYSTIVSVSKNNDGQVTSLYTDMITMNRLQAKISHQIAAYLEDMETQTVTIPLGTLVGGQFLSGRGPEIPFKVMPVGSVHTELYNEFDSAGINQTIHRIMLYVEVNVTTVMPVYTVTARVGTNLSIAETMIVGGVPDTYTDINGDMSGVLDLWKDYAK